MVMLPWAGGSKLGLEGVQLGLHVKVGGAAAEGLEFVL
jgi:hypothetical protein